MLNDWKKPSTQFFGDVLSCFSLVYLFLALVSLCNSGWIWPYYGVQAGLQLMILQLGFLSTGMTATCHHLWFMQCWKTEPRALSVYAGYSTNQAAPSLYLLMKQYSAQQHSTETIESSFAGLGRGGLWPHHMHTHEGSGSPSLAHTLQDRLEFFQYLNIFICPVI